MKLIHNKIDGQSITYNIDYASKLSDLIDTLVDIDEEGLTYVIDIEGDCLFTESAVTANTFLFNLWADLTFDIQNDSELIVSEFNSLKEAYQKAIEVCDLMKV